MPTRKTKKAFRRQEFITMSTEMLLAMEAGTKDTTRREISPQPESLADILTMPAPVEDVVQALYSAADRGLAHLSMVGPTASYLLPQCPYGGPGDFLYVKEIWAKNTDGAYLYKADRTSTTWTKWKSPRFMPKEAARFVLQIQSVRVERIYDITEPEAIREGVQRVGDWWRDYLDPANVCTHAVKSFITLYQHLKGKDATKGNPFVWVIRFKVIKKPQNV